MSRPLSVLWCRSRQISQSFPGVWWLMEEWEMALEHGEWGRGGRSGSVLVGRVKLMDL